MLNIFRCIRNRIKKDNRGSAIVLVIVALAMVGILAVTIMWMSMTNYYTKATDKGNKQGFYSSETILEQIKAGLEADASWAAARAYAYILTKDYSATSTADRDYEFKKEYQNYFVEKVADSSDLSKYDLNHLLSFVDSAAGVQLTYPSSGTIKYLSSTTGDRKFIHSYSSNLMKLEGIHLEYTDQSPNGNEYVSVIDTDIIIMVPDVSFTQTSLLPDVFEYALVADKKLMNTNTGGGDTIKGNIYAGDDGIELLNGLTISDAGMIISKGDVKIGTDDSSMSGTTLSISGESGVGNTEFWANDITLGRGKQLSTNKVDTYVADDLTLAGRKSKVVMSGAGNYYGYGNSDSIASKSSAVVVNGIGSEVNMDSLGKVMLLGRTFVSVPYETIDPVTLTASKNSIDFAMGESLAVKGEQVAFLVPDDCVSYVDKSVSSNSVLMPNPFVKSQYPEDKDGDGIKDHEIRVNLSSLSSYVDVTNGYRVIYPYGSNLGYVYMQMSGDKANEYYEAYYKRNMEKLDNYFLVYAGSDKIELPAGSNISSAGNFITALKTDGSVPADKLTQNINSQLYSANLQTGEDAGQAAAINADYETKKTNLCAKLMKQGVTATELANTLFDNLILRDDVKTLVSLNTNTNPATFEATTGGNVYKAVFARNNPADPSNVPYQYSDTSIRVLVVDGDVDVNNNFTGLLIASGTVTIKGGHTITSIVNVTDTTQMQALKDTLQVKKTVWHKPSVSAGSLAVEEERSALQYFRDGSAYDLDGLQKNGSSTVSKNNVDFAELVKFNNWIKK